MLLCGALAETQPAQQVLRSVQSKNWTTPTESEGICISISLTPQGSTNCSYYQKCQSATPHQPELPSAIPTTGAEDTTPPDLHLSVERQEKEGRHSSFSLLARSPATFLTIAWEPLAIQLQLRSSARCTSHRELDRSCEVIAGSKTRVGLSKPSR